QLDRMTLPARQALHRCPQGSFVDCCLRKVRSRYREGFMYGVESGLPRAAATLAPKAINDPPLCDRDEPGAERAPWVVGMPDRVDGEQNVLYRFLDVVGAVISPAGEGADIGSHFFEKAAIGSGIAVLRRGHEIGPIAFAGRRNPLWRGQVLANAD